MHRRLRLLTVIAALTLALAACAEDGATDAGSATGEIGADTTVAAAPVDDDQQDDGSEDAAASLANTDAYCTALINALDQEAVSVFNEDPDLHQPLMQDLLTAVEAAAATAPADQVEWWTEYRDLAAEMAAVSWDDIEDSGLGEEWFDLQFRSETVSTFAESNCGYEGYSVELDFEEVEPEIEDVGSPQAPEDDVVSCNIVDAQTYEIRFASSATVPVSYNGSVLFYLADGTPTEVEGIFGAESVQPGELVIELDDPFFADEIPDVNGSCLVQSVQRYRPKVMDPEPEDGCRILSFDPDVGYEVEVTARNVPEYGGGSLTTLVLRDASGARIDEIGVIRDDAGPGEVDVSTISFDVTEPDAQCAVVAKQPYTPDGDLVCTEPDGTEIDCFDW